MAEQILCLTYFDQIIGPSLFYCALHPAEGSQPDVSQPGVKFGEIDSDYPDLTRILEFNEDEGIFIFAFRKYQTINYIFYIDSQLARGGKELVMLSYMMRSAFFKNEITDVFKYLESKGPELEKMAKDMEKIEGLANQLHNHNKHPTGKSKFDLAPTELKEEIITLFNKYLKSFSPMHPGNISRTSKKSTKKIFIFGAKNVGKTTFLKSIETMQFHNQKNNDLPTRIYEIVIDNIEIMSYDCIERDFVCEQCRNYDNCLKQSQGYIFIVNVSDKSTLNEARERYNKIINRCNDIDNGKTPILIVGNIFNNKLEITPEMVEKTFNLKVAEECGMEINYVSLNLVEEQEGIMNSLRWLINKML